MNEWIASIGPGMFWPVLLIVGAILMAVVWKVATALYEQLSGIAAGAFFMLIGLGVVLFCAYDLLSTNPLTYGRLFVDWIGIMVAIALMGAGAFGLRNAGDF